MLTMEMRGSSSMELPRTDTEESLRLLAEAESHRQFRLLHALLEAHPGSQPSDLLRVVSPRGVSPELINLAVLDSMDSHFDLERHEGAWDPAVLRELEHPTDPANPAKVLVLEVHTGIPHLVEHIGVTGIAGLQLPS
ncbi:MAG: hypothetical protein V4702_04820 [Patescibacteria group bacterium]